MPLLLTDDYADIDDDGGYVINIMMMIIFVYLLTLQTEDWEKVFVRRYVTLWRTRIYEFIAQKFKVVI